jgi:hypothetical protein
VRKGAYMTNNRQTGLSDELRSSIRKEAVSQVSKWVIGAIVVLVAAALAGWWLKLKPMFIQEIGGVPPHAVMAFNDDTCPSGWVPYIKAGGRVIIGTGPSERDTKFDRDDHGRHLKVYSLQQHGGDQLVVSLAGNDVGDSIPYANSVPWVALHFGEKI